MKHQLKEQGYAVLGRHLVCGGALGLNVGSSVPGAGRNAVMNLPDVGRRGGASSSLHSVPTVFSASL